ncbi:c-type cytochrome biogenesis protein CcmI [Halioxenophilus aromaticivorans]
MWACFLVLSAIAVLFSIWPFLKNQTRAIDSEYSRSAANTELYKTHLADLEASFSQGDIEPEVYDQLKAELGRSLLEDNTTGDESIAPAKGAKPVLWLLVALVPLVSLVYYYERGPHLELNLRQLIIEQNRLAQANSQTLSSEEIELTQEVTEQLRALIAKDPENLSNYYLLARNLVTLQDFSGAISAYQEILSRDPKQPQILAEFGQTLFMASGSQMLPQVKTLADSALALDGNNTLALSLAGITSYETQEHQAALEYWQKAVGLMGPNNPEAGPLLAGIDNINTILRHSGGSAQSNATTADGTGEASAGDGTVADVSVTVRVSLSPQVEYSPNQTVFVYARAWQGPKMPLAIQKLTAADLPVEITLSESMSMMDGMTIASVGDIELVARLSTDGSPTTKPGDWQASVGPVKQAAFDQVYTLEIATQVE